jgi:hypothetical protein
MHSQGEVERRAPAPTESGSVVGGGSEIPGAAGSATVPTLLDAAPTSRRMSFIGSTERTRGTTSKLFSGGGDGTNHSSVFPFQGSLPARLPRFRLRRTFATVTSTPIARINEPIVEIRLKTSQPALAG